MQPHWFNIGGAKSIIWLAAFSMSTCQARFNPDGLILDNGLLTAREIVLVCFQFVATPAFNHASCMVTASTYEKW